LVNEEEVVRRKGLGKTSSTVVVFLRGASDVAGLLRKGLWLGGRWHSVRRFEAVQPVRKKTGWVWMREWMEKEGKMREEGGRKDRERIESINRQLAYMRKGAEELEDKGKREKYGGLSGFGEMQSAKPVAGLVLKKDMGAEKVKMDFDFKAEVDAFFGEKRKAFGDKAGPPIASGSTVSPEAKKFSGDDAWKMEFGWRP